MSQGPTADLSGNAAVHAAAALTPEQVEGVLAEFRSWLRELAAGSSVAEAPAGDDEAIDLHTLLAQLTALRHEVNLQTRATRAQQEQNAETLRQLSQAQAALGQAQSALQQGGQQARDEVLRPALKTLVDVSDALSLAGREAQRAQGAILSALGQLAEREQPVPLARPGGLARWFGGGSREEPAADHPEWTHKVQETTSRVRQFLDALLAGYTMSVRRAERALEQFHLEPIPCVGRPFDPELMEVVEAVPDSGRPAGEVLDEVRRGYLWNGRVFRHAQVRVARS